MKNIFIIFSLILCNQGVNAQYQLGLNWVTGLGGNQVVFSGSNIITKSGFNTNEYFLPGSSIINDANGYISIYSDGYNLYNGSNGLLIDDGDTIVPIKHFMNYYGHSPYAQTSIILPKDSNSYYFITPAMSDLRFDSCKLYSGSCYFDLLLYNVVDMNANGGAGKVVQRMVPLMQHAQLRKTQMMACRHGNGKDWWLLKNEGDNADIHTFLITKDSIYDKGLQYFSSPNWGEWDIRGQSTFSSDGSKFATTSHGLGIRKVFIGDFDRCNGLVTNPYTIEIPMGSMYDPTNPTNLDVLCVGACFSPNGRFLYVPTRRNIYQYDLVDSALLLVAGMDTTLIKFQDYETAYLGPDNKIYIGNFGGQSKQMSRIDNPDVKGAGCNFCPRCLRLDSLGGVFSVGAPPTMPNFALGADTLNPNCWPQSQSESGVRSAEWVVYPNPATEVLHIDVGNYYSQLATKKIELFNSVGQPVKRLALGAYTSTLTMDISSLPHGVYYIKWGVECKKVIIE